MADLKLYFTPALLLLVLTCPLWQVGHLSPVPLMHNTPITDSCVFYAKSLLWNITDTLKQNNLFNGFTCTEQNVELNMETRTPSLCAPKISACSGVTESEFDQDSCLTNIGKDLIYYHNFLTAQPDPERLLSPTVLFSLRELMENCFAWTLSKDVPLQQVTPDRERTYDERLNLCKVLKGFQVRTITINRAIGYISSGEHSS
ncbi:uncharacterized protein LOC115374900 [Myripristis murdjan]|uniref:uncharacterized protein LOC115374900 n=1 Tax=Myripristis murdjan TaxID=586833 RepID=UPI001175CAF1|nr:uncharacterized protein LOC115374900 [Myripristis murdjan]